jgi:hypothetical protein
MNRLTNRKILLSIRERPLPVLWLLAWLTPYLIFSLAAAPHFHAADFSFYDAGRAQVHDATRGDSASPPPSPRNERMPDAADCVLCQWSSHSSATDGATSLFIELRAATVEYSRSETTTLLPPAVAVSARGPPFQA